MKCDLHTHSVHSDGSYTPAELVAEAKEKNLIIALTDHNTVSGLTDFLHEAEIQGVSAIGGTEISTIYAGREFHLIGLFISPEHYCEVETLCLEYHGLKEKSNIELIERLRALGYDISYDEIKRTNIKGQVNRAHIAAALVRGGYFASINDAFDNILNEKYGVYIPPRRLPLTDAIRFLRSISALPILAHPLKDIGIEELRDMLPELIEAGLLAIETMHSSYSDEKIAASRALAKEFGLHESGGSDFHGVIKPGIMLGCGKGNLDISSDIFDDLCALHIRQICGEL